jgi:hypothetical protein
MIVEIYLKKNFTNRLPFYQTLEPTVWIRHYNFANFADYGSVSGWSPDWFNVVRDPVDRVSFMFF